MPKVTLNKEAFKALASETRLKIIKTLDGKQMNLTELSKKTDLNKATLHEHLKKLLDTGLVKKKQRPGHKWVYYKLSWKGESLLHPENTKIVVLFATSFIALFAAITQMVMWAKGTIISASNFNEIKTLDATNTMNGNGSTLPSPLNGTSIPEEGKLIVDKGRESLTMIYQDPFFLYLAIICFVCFAVILSIAIHKLWKNKPQKL